MDEAQREGIDDLAAPAGTAVVPNGRATMAQGRGRRLRLVALAPLLALVALLCWSIASPMGSSPDDDYHLASIWCGLGDRPGICAPGSDASKRTVPEALTMSSRCYMGEPTISAACQTDAFSLDPSKTIDTSRGSFQNNYPPLYYATMSLFVGPDILASIWVMRLVNVLLFVAITTLLYLFLPVRRRPTLLWAWILSVVPLGMFLLASNNPSAWAIIGIGSAWLALLGYFESRGAPKVVLGVLFVVTGLMAAGSRGDAAIYLVISVAVVFILTFMRQKVFWRDAILPIAMVVVAIAFYFSSRQANVASQGLDNPGSAATSNVMSGLGKLINVPYLWSGVFGAWPLGWFDTVMPAVVSFGAAAAFVAVAFSGVTVRSRRKTIAVIVVAALLWLVPAFVIIQSRDAPGLPVQPRYLLPLMVLFAGLCVLQANRRPLRLTAMQAVFVMLSLAVAQSVALYYNLRRYLTGTNVKGFNLDSGVEWWWNIAISPMVVWGIGSVAFAALVIIVVREIARPRVVLS